MSWQESAEAWDRRLEELVASYIDAEDWPPLIVEYVDGRLPIRDGNHHYGALERLNVKTCWIILWYPDEAAYYKHGDDGFRIRISKGIVGGRQSLR